MGVSSPHDLRVANDWPKKDQRLSWGEAPFWQRDELCQFHLSIKKNRAVLAVCKSQIEDQSITMDCFESRPFENPLKGKILKAFTDAHALIANNLNVNSIDVREPNTVATQLLEALGFDNSGGYPSMKIFS